ncbi:MAG: fibronectin type III-like domain-contianing protein, partial [Ruminiclostridium sp.]|nr:fibronectin type III-like domain-contianing protein [Ruminiclostridium sp.]
CGKLAESFPVKLSDTPCYLTYGNKVNAVYNEGVFVGYRYYDTKEMNVLYPFGHGLSYTSYEYSDLELSQSSITDKDTLTVSVTITNTGNMAGKEIVQLYVCDKTGYEFRPLKELKGFEKVELQPGESKEVIFTLDSRSFSYYNEAMKDWFAASGKYEILIGKSSRDIQLKAEIDFRATKKIPFVAHENTVFGEFMDYPEGKEALEILRPLVSEGLLGGQHVDDVMLKNMAEAMPLRQIRSFGGISDETMKKAIDSLNKNFGGYKSV